MTAIFSKRPEPGRVKTRLSPYLSPVQAAQLAEAMLLDTTELLAGSDEFRLALYFAPAEAQSWFADTFPELTDQRAQEGEGLAERMLHFFASELNGTAAISAVAVGSDAPLIRPEIIVEAHERLQRAADLVLGPDDGGGYYLIGMNAPDSALFLEIEMSTRDMRQRTVELARQRGLTVELLEPLYDIDLPSDLTRLRTDLAKRNASDFGYPRRTAAFLDQPMLEST